jgi:uncharacterized protein (DUF433 family)
LKSAVNTEGYDAHERPRYSLARAAQYVQIAPATLRSWVVGRPYGGGSRYFVPLLTRPDATDPRLSFSNLVEAHVLRSLRTRHGVPMSAVRTALDYSARDLQIERLLLSDELRTAAGTIFIEHLGRLVDLGRSGQIALQELLQAHLQRIDRDIKGLPLRLYPVVSPSGLSGPRIVGIDPAMAFGHPFIVGKGVRTSTIVERLDAGESRELVAADYLLEDREIDEAIFYERTAA